MDPRTAAAHALTASASAGLVMDFDGVLSPITDDPAASTLLPGVEEVLAGLASKLNVVALLSGRPASFLASRAAIPGVELYGSYGLEQVTADGIAAVPGAQQWMTAVVSAAELLHQRLDDVEGIYVEEKSLAVAVHWRRAPDREGARDIITPLVREVVDTYGLRREPGKLVEELRMPLDHDKGTALRKIIKANDLQTIAYAGDDRGDLPAFAVAVANGHALVVESADIAPEVKNISGAHFDSPDDFVSWLKSLSDAMGR